MIQYIISYSYLLSIESVLKIINAGLGFMFFCRIILVIDINQNQLYKSEILLVY